MLKKSTLREIKTSLARYLAIFAIVALGVGFFAGLKLCKACMVKTANAYMTEHSGFDYQLMTSYGIDDDSIKLAEKTDGVLAAEGSKQVDVIVDVNKEEQILKAISVPDKINTLRVVEGRLPKNNKECVVDDYGMTGSAYKIGSTIKLAANNDEDTLDKFKTKEYTIVGKVNTPLYLDYQRGSTELGDGDLDTFFFIQEDAFDFDYYTAMYINLEGTEAYFSDAYHNKLKSYEKPMKALAKAITKQRRETARKDAQEELDEKKQEYADSLAEYNSKKSDAQKEFDSAQSKIDKGSKELSSNKKKLSGQLSSAKTQLAGLESQLDDINGKIAAMEAAGKTDTDEYRALLSGRESVKAGINQCNAAISQINAGLKTISAKEKELNKGQKTLDSNKKKANTEFTKAEKELDDAKAKLDDAQEEIDEMETGNYYALSVRDNSGYSSFESNSQIVSNIAKVFPVFFFLVAALVCMTTMTRMIDEQRTQIGILKALGYSNGAILGKYVFYSGSGALLGALFGFFVGCKVFPMVIWNAYTMMYDFSDTVDFVFEWKLLLISLACSMLCSVGATWVAISADFKEIPAGLIRPKTPPAGKRILLERIPAIWNRIGFLYKVSIRNIFRYKKRFFMMVLGVSGCTALLIAGIGIKSTISKVAEYQFSEISLYDYQLAFTKNMSEDAQSDFLAYADKKTDGAKADVLFLTQSAADAKFKGKKVESTIVASDDKNFSKYISLHDGDKKLEIPDKGKVIIVRKIQKELGVQPGDKITLKDGYREMTVEISAVCDYFVGEDIFMSTETYEAGFGKKAAIKSAYVKLADGLSEKEIRAHATACGKHDSVAAVVLNLDTLDMVANMMKSLNAVVYVVIMCAGLLAFIVLYNLTNINITERIREIATIKVLGFNQLETSQYVFRENLFLTGIAAIVGMPLGKLLLDFVIDNIVVSMIFFQTRISNLDYAIAVALTFVFAFVVNLAMRKRLRNISMTESLKSIE